MRCSSTARATSVPTATRSCPCTPTSPWASSRTWWRTWARSRAASKRRQRRSPASVPRCLAFPGLLAIDTYVDRLHIPAVTTLLAFSDEAALQRFLADPAMGRLGLAFDRFIGDHDHQSYAAPPPLYRVPSLSAP